MNSTFSEWMMDPCTFTLQQSDSVLGALPPDSPLLSGGVSTVDQLVHKLEQIYCDSMTVEVSHMVVSHSYSGKSPVWW